MKIERASAVVRFLRYVPFSLFAMPWSTETDAAVVAFDWTVAPTPYMSVATVPVGSGTLTITRSGYAGGLCPIDTSGDGAPDGMLTADAQLVSQVFFDGFTRTYEWKPANLGSGAIIDFLGDNTPGFMVSLLSPLNGTAGPDRVVGTSDDLPVQTLSTTAADIREPKVELWGIIMNPSTGLGAALLAPASVPEPATSALLGLGLDGLGFSRRKQ